MSIRRGYTLIELLVVMSVIGVLLIIGVPSTKTISSKINLERSSKTLASLLENTKAEAASPSWDISSPNLFKITLPSQADSNYYEVSFSIFNSDTTTGPANDFDHLKEIKIKKTINGVPESITIPLNNGIYVDKVCYDDAPPTCINSGETSGIRYRIYPIDVSYDNISITQEGSPLTAEAGSFGKYEIYLKAKNTPFEKIITVYPIVGTVTLNDAPA